VYDWKGGGKKKPCIMILAILLIKPTPSTVPRKKREKQLKKADWFIPFNAPAEAKSINGDKGKTKETVGTRQRKDKGKLTKERQRRMLVQVSTSLQHHSRLFFPSNTKTLSSRRRRQLRLNVNLKECGSSPSSIVGNLSIDGSTLHSGSFHSSVPHHFRLLAG
jgi:hypothetical protein